MNLLFLNAVYFGLMTIVLLVVPSRHQKRIWGGVFALFFVALLMFDYQIFVTKSEISVYYIPLLQDPPTWEILRYQGMPLFFVIFGTLKEALGISEVSIVILARVVITALTMLATMQMARILAPQGSTKSAIGILALNAPLFLLMDYTFSVLTIGDQFKQALGTPFFLFYINGTLNKRRILPIAFAFAAIASHHVFLPLILIFQIARMYSQWFKLTTRTLILAFLSVASSSILVQLAVSGVNYWGDRVNHPVPTGPLDALLLAPGAILATTFYLYVFIKVIHARKLLPGGFAEVFLTTFVLFSVSKVNILGVSFIEPARMYSLMAPFTAVFLAILVHFFGEFRATALTILAILYNFILVEIAASSQFSFFVFVTSEVSNHLVLALNDDRKLGLLCVLVALVYFFCSSRLSSSDDV